MANSRARVSRRAQPGNSAVRAAMMLPCLVLSVTAAVAASAPAAKLSASAPAATQRYVLDASQSALSFSFVQAGATVQGRLRAFAATLDCTGPTPAGCALKVDVSVASIDTQDKDRDAMLRGPDLFAVQRFPAARFVSSQFGPTSVAGALTLRDQTHTLLKVPLAQRWVTEGGAPIVWLSGAFVINRLDYGIGQGEWSSTEWVANAVTVTFRLRLVAATALR